jgi:transcriptional regulator with XRE-family HTH domain
MNINDKIKQILIDKNLTPSYFADEIGVQRSSISHILSGRNRPSFDIIQKIIRRFPELGYEWIMEEDNQSNSPMASSGSTYQNRGPVRSSNDRFTNSSTPSYTTPMPVRSIRHEIPPAGPMTTPAPVPLESPVFEQSSAIEKKVERILIFYTDGSFREYTPSV